MRLMPRVADASPLVAWRHRIFAVTWLSYAGFYLCRKNFSVVMPLLTSELGFTRTDLAWILTGYSLIYMLGQFANGLLSDRYGSRFIVVAGLIVSVSSNITMGLGVTATVSRQDGRDSSRSWQPGFDTRNGAW